MVGHGGPLRSKQPPIARADAFSSALVSVDLTTPRLNRYKIVMLGAGSTAFIERFVSGQFVTADSVLGFGSLRLAAIVAADTSGLCVVAI